MRHEYFSPKWNSGNSHRKLKIKNNISSTVETFWCNEPSLSKSRRLEVIRKIACANSLPKTFRLGKITLILKPFHRATTKQTNLNYGPRNDHGNDSLVGKTSQTATFISCQTITTSKFVAETQALFFDHSLVQQHPKPIWEKVWSGFCHEKEIE